MFRSIRSQLFVALLPALATTIVLGGLVLAAAAAQARADRQRHTTQEFIHGLHQLADDVRRHRTASLALLGNDRRFETPLRQFRQEIGAEFTALDSLSPYPWAASTALASQWNQVRDRWEYLRAYHLFRTPDENNEMHVRLQGDLMALATQAADSLGTANAGPLGNWRVWQLAAGGALLFGLSLTPLLAFLAAGHVRQQLRSIGAVCAGVARGHYTARVPVRRADEVGQLAETVNGVLDQTEDLSCFCEANHRLQAALLLLLEDIHHLAEGDLAHEVNCLSDLPASLAEAFDSLVQRLRRTVGAAQMTALHLSTATKQLQLLTADLAQATEDRSGDVGILSRTLQEMSMAGRAVSDRATAAAGAIEEAAVGIRGGNAALRLATEAVNALRARLEVIARHARRFSENTPQVAATVAHFEELVRWSRLLVRPEGATNGAGPGLDVALAESLATRAADATRYLAGVTALHQDLRRLTVALEEMSRDSVHSTLLTHQAGQATASAEAALLHAGQLCTALATAVGEQSKRGEAIGCSADALGQTMQQLTRDSWRAAHLSRDLAKLAEEVYGALTVFQMGEGGTPFNSVLSLDGMATRDGRWPEEDGAEGGEEPAHDDGSSVVEALSEK